MLRRLAERLSRGVVLKRRLPSEFGRVPVFVTPDAALSYLVPGNGAFDPDLLGLARDFVRPGDTVWDIGANVGQFAFAAGYCAGAGGLVVAVEPDTFLTGLLRRSASVNTKRGINVAVLSAAIADRAGVLSFMIAERGRASNALELVGGRTDIGGVRERQLVPVVMLDQLLEVSPPPQFVKIDVEGAEVLVLRGASRLLREHRPVIQCEVGKAQAAETTEILHAAGYALFDAGSPASSRMPLPSCVFATLAIPG